MTAPNHKGEVVQLPCLKCRGTWTATVGRRGWNRCRNCGCIHSAGELEALMRRDAVKAVVQ
jgi:hypothetical protein